jgi:hypothetical protein
MLKSYALLVEVKLCRFFDSPLEEREIQSLDAIDDAILQALDEQPFTSLRQIAKRIFVPT